MTLKQWQSLFREKLPPSVSDHEIQQWLGHCVQKSWGEFTLNSDYEPEPRQEQIIRSGLERLQQGEPVAYIIGQRFFFKDSFYVDSSVLIPRHETEILVELALEHIPQDKDGTIIDLGTGSGCIGLSIAKYRPQTQVHLIDSSALALEVCKKNGRALGVHNAHFQRARIGADNAPIPGIHQGQVDLVVANPPYIAHGDPRVCERVHRFEPHEALYAPNQGMMWIHNWLIWSYDYLKRGGWFLFEFGQHQEIEIQQHLSQMAYRNTQVIKDYGGINRFIKTQK
jgi:release factor glutamine methyltransferase